MKIETIISYLETREEYISKEELENVKITLLKIEKLEAQKLLTIKEKGDLEYKKGNLKEAIELYSKYIDISPSDYIVISNRAACYHKLRLFKESIKDCKRGIEINPEFLKFYLRLGVLMVDVDIKESIKYLEKALELKPDDEVIQEQLEMVKSMGKPINQTSSSTCNDSSVNKIENSNDYDVNCCPKEFNEHLSEVINNSEYDEAVKKLVENKSLEELQNMVKEMMGNIKDKK